MTTVIIDRASLLHERDWHRRKWAIHPKPCEKCGMRKVVCWVAAGADERWWVDCLACYPPDRVVHGKMKTGAAIDAVVCEMPALVSTSNDAPNLTICLRPGATVTAGALQRASRSFTELAMARVTKARHPREWALELRDFGRVWAPSDPRGGTWRRGEALPLRSTALRETGADRRRQARQDPHVTVLVGTPSRGGRKCYSCKAELGAGQTAWRADVSGRPDKGRWSAYGLRTLWCPSCVAAVQVVVESDGVGVVVRHMRVIEGGAP